jgi:hypothetical protein
MMPDSDELSETEQMIAAIRQLQVALEQCQSLLAAAAEREASQNMAGNQSAAPVSKPSQDVHQPDPK